MDVSHHRLSKLAERNFHFLGNGIFKDHKIAAVVVSVSRVGTLLEHRYLGERNKSGSSLHMQRPFHISAAG